MGYKEFEDYIFYNHKPLFFPAGEKVEYEDEYGIKIVSNGAFPIFISKSVWNCDINIGDNVKAAVDSKIIVEGSNSHCLIGERVVFGKNNLIIVRNNSALEIGSKSTFWDNVSFHAENMAKISIGEDCMFSKDITVFAGDGHAILDVDTGKRMNPIWPFTDKDNINIGNHVWVGIRNTLLACTIKDSSIIGAGSLVKGIFPNNAVIAGVPARVLKKNVTWNRNAYIESIEGCNPEFVGYTEMEE